VKSVLSSGIGIAVLATIGVATFGPNRPGRAYIASWIERRTIASQWPHLVTGSGRLGSSSDRAVVLVEFGDYQCPWCRKAQPSVDSLLREYPNVAVVFHSFPLAIHQRALPASLASLCAGEQGAFKAMHGFLYSDTSWETDSAVEWTKIAATAGVPDTIAFAACIQRERHPQLDTSVSTGHALGVFSTPTFLSKNGYLGSPPSVENFRTLLGLPPAR
jgi:protein-disulfide isomerase